jgi:hypothetical protein
MEEAPQRLTSRQSEAAERVAGIGGPFYLHDRPTGRTPGLSSGKNGHLPIITEHATGKSV